VANRYQRGGQALYGWLTCLLAFAELIYVGCILGCLCYDMSARDETSDISKDQYQTSSDPIIQFDELYMSWQ
jgi:hypothetical protein